MRLFLLLPLLAFGYLHAQDVPKEVPKVDEPPPEVEMPSTVWDHETAERVSVDEYRKRMAQRGTRGVIAEQVPFVRPAVVDGGAVLGRRLDEEARLWAQRLYLMDVLASPLRFK